MLRRIYIDLVFVYVYIQTCNLLFSFNLLCCPCHRSRCVDTLFHLAVEYYTAWNDDHKKQLFLKYAQTEHKHFLNPII